MNNLSRNTSYELHVLRNSRWQIRSIYGPEGRVAAVTVAKQLSRDPQVDGVRVIKEVFDSYSADDSTESVIYSSRKVRRRPVKPLAERDIDLDHQPGEDWMGLGRRRRLAQIAARKLFRQQRRDAAASWDELPLATKTVVGLTAAFAVATLSTLLAALFLPGTSMGRSDRVTAYLVMFMLIFLACGGPVIIWSLVTAFGINKAKPVEPKQDEAPTPPPIRPRKTVPPQPPPPPPDPEPAPISAQADNAQAFLSAFAKQSRRKANAAFDLTNDYLAFGVDLFVAGASEPVCDYHGVSTDERQTVLTDALTALDLDAKKIDSFVARLPEYLLADVRYMEMYTAGRDAMAGHIDGDSNSSDSLSLALADWSGTTHETTADSLVTLMFTAIDDLDGITGRLGDAASARIARMLNQIVEDQVIGHGGKRVKHTSDGTMAAFSSATQAVNAAIAMQRDAEKLRIKEPDMPLNLRIGMNAGAPVVEDEDYFGTVVQCAARLCAGADINGIDVTETICGLCPDLESTARFIPRGERGLKGFDTAVTVYSVDWKEPKSAVSKADPSSPKSAPPTP